MPRVALKVIPNSNRIEAPDFCPYYTEDIVDWIPSMALGDGHTVPIPKTTCKTISPDICSVCKMCTFIPDATSPLEFDPQENTRCKEYLVNFNSHLNRIITKQISFLLNKERSPLAILITANILRNMIDYAVEDKKRREVLFHYFIDFESVVCHAHGCPVYFSRKLTRSEIQVVGETEWK